MGLSVKSIAEYKTFCPWQRAFVRVALWVGLPFVMVWTFFATLVKEIGDAFWMASNHAGQAIDDFREAIKQMKAIDKEQAL